MPQGRRKTPFSGKAKKEQLKAKKQSKLPGGQRSGISNFVKGDSDGEQDVDSQKLNYQPSQSGQSQFNRYALQFQRETDQEIRECKEQARQALKTGQETDLEIDIDDYFDKHLDFPKRPTWSYNMTTQELDAREQRYFMSYVDDIHKKFDAKQLSYFELNLETWRQFWRVLEMSDIVLIIADIRYPAFMFPPMLYNYVTEILKKNMILILNKIDLVPAPLVAAWKNYFNEKYPELHVIMFTSLPGYNLVGSTADKAGLQIRRRKGRQRMALEGTQTLYETCKTIVDQQVDLSSWQKKIQEETNCDSSSEEHALEIEKVIEVKKQDTSYFEHEKYKNGILTIGCIGQPNVGKSSVMNALMGKKVVSVSRTPGHTKHFQTIFLTPTVRLCDCPGLVFPSRVPKSLQVLMGSFPIAQLRVPYTSIKFLAEHLDLPKMLRIDHPEGDEEWSAMDVCDGWAKKRGFLTAKAARLDSFRAANNLLRMALDGKICLAFTPPNYTHRKEFWAHHEDVEKVKWIQARTHYSEVQGDVSDVSDDYQSSTASKANEDDSDQSDNSDSSTDKEIQWGVANKFALLDAAA